MVWPWRRAREDKIFINYRREDSGGFAGRLSDSLTAFFGGERVFRDVTGIDYGRDFERVIDERVAESCAIVVLIGDKWTKVTNPDGVRRIDDPGDYVRREIEAALASGVTIVPVLIGEASMPRREELPEALAPLARRNAMTVSDERWEHDVTRLAKVLAIDVPGSVAQQRLDLLRIAALLLLCAATVYAAIAFAAAMASLVPHGRELARAGFPPLAAAIPFIAILLAGAATLAAAPAMEATKRRYAWAAVLLAAIGTLAPFLYYAVENEAEPALSLVAMFAASSTVTAILLVLIALAGFRAK
jgi:hypothetical protein